MQAPAASVSPRPRGRPQLGSSAAPATRDQSGDEAGRSRWRLAVEPGFGHLVLHSQGPSGRLSVRLSTAPWAKRRLQLDEVTHDAQIGDRGRPMRPSPTTASRSTGVRGPRPARRRPSWTLARPRTGHPGRFTGAPGLVEPAGLVKESGQPENSRSERTLARPCRVEVSLQRGRRRPGCNGSPAPGRRRWACRVRRLLDRCAPRRRGGRSATRVENWRFLVRLHRALRDAGRVAAGAAGRSRAGWPTS